MASGVPASASRRGSPAVWIPSPRPHRPDPSGAAPWPRSAYANAQTRAGTAGRKDVDWRPRFCGAGV